jgi:hypothetical protein
VAVEGCPFWALAWAAWFRSPEEVLYGAKKGAVESQVDRWSVIARNPRFWSCVAGAAFAIPIIHVVSAWTPLTLSSSGRCL